MGQELKNAKIEYVSYVDKAANKRQFFLTKSASANNVPRFEKTVQLIHKADDPQKLVYGVVYEPNVEDTHGDFMTAAEIEKAAHYFMKEARKIDKQHDYNEGVGDVVESYVAPADFEIGEHKIAKGSWVMVTKASDEIWEQIEKGEITGYSMAGWAEVEKQEDKGLMNTVIEAIKAAFGGGGPTQATLEKGEVVEAFNRGKQKRDFWAAKDLFNDVFYDEMWDNQKGPDVQRIQEAARDFAELLGQLATDVQFAKSVADSRPVEKAGKKISTTRLDKLKGIHQTLSDLLAEVDGTDEEEKEVKKEEIQEILKEALAPLETKIQEIEKTAQGTGEQEPQPEVLTKEDVAEVIKAAVNPLSERIGVIEKARGINQAVPEGEVNPVEKSDDPAGGVFDSLFRLSR